MIIGDEYVYLRAAAGGLPPHLAGELVVLPPAAFTRLQRSLDRPRAPHARRRGAITRRLDRIPPQQRRSISDLHPDVCVALDSADLAAIVMAVNQKARKLGTPITPYTADHIAAARMFGHDTVYAGNARNIPRPARSDQPMLGIRWLLLS